MIIIEDASQFSQFADSCVATIGKFDGVHLGHQLILDQLTSKADQYQLPSLVILIEPHPEEFFAAERGDCPARLSSIREKLDLLEGFGIQYVFTLKFDRALSELSAQDYIQQILVDGLGIACFIVGNDFRFGHQRRGDFKLLQETGKQAGFTVVETAAYEYNGQRISSTFIREALAAGDFELVEKLLGRPYSIKGTVEQGQKLGADLGFPTCNIDPQRLKIPLHGIYACEVRLWDGHYPAAVNIGYRPTVTDDGKAVLEAHILDFSKNLYGKPIEVIFRSKIRDEEKFADLEQLKLAMSEDVEKVRELLSAPGARTMYERL
ncbi:MAG: bifunctional riboflavin kinase/FAD synthetase [Gammaproteobacteria bacterium]